MVLGPLTLAVPAAWNVPTQTFLWFPLMSASSQNRERALSFYPLSYPFSRSTDHHFTVCVFYHRSPLLEQTQDVGGTEPKRKTIMEWSKGFQ